MWDCVEVRLQIRVVHLLEPGGNMRAYRVDRLMSVPSRTKPVGAVQEVGLKDRLENQQSRRLNDTVLDRGNSQRSQPTVRLGDIDAFNRLRAVALGAKLFVQLPEEGVPLRFTQGYEVLTGYAIHPGSAVVIQHQTRRSPQHVVPIDPVIQGVEPELGFLFGLLT